MKDQTELSQKLLAFLLALLGANLAEAEVHNDVLSVAELPQCAQIDQTTKTVLDYRDRLNPKAQARINYKDTYKNHYLPALNAFERGIRSRGVVGDLHFILRGLPNHIEALQLIARYDAADGSFAGFPPAECYFRRARRLFPGDIDVLMVQGQWFWKKDMIDESLAAFEQALKLSPTSAEAHYNVGLVYFEQGKYPAAMRHAQTAYELGYPLPGLKSRLEEVGQWRPTPP